METNGTVKVLLAFLGGVAAGAALGVILAPEKGEDTRKKIAEGVRNFGDLVKKQANNGLEHLANAGEQAKDKFSNAANQAADKFNDGSDAVKKAAQEVSRS